MNKKLSVIVPVYNETLRVGNLKKIWFYYKKTISDFELVVVNDGSSDNTEQLINSMIKDKNYKVISYSRNRGKGYALRRGFELATGDYILFMDIDISTPLSETGKFFKYINKFPVVIGTRKLKSANIIVRQPWLRESMGKVFTWLSSSILGVSVSDFTCGFKMFTKKSGKEVFGKGQIERWGFDSEILFLAKKFKYKIKEIPVSWENDLKTRVRFPQDVIRSMQEIMQIRWNDWRGIYEKKRR